MELLFELVLTLSLSFMFTFLFAKLIFMHSTSPLTDLENHDNDDDCYSGQDNPAALEDDDSIKKPIIKERYFFDSNTKEKEEGEVLFCYEVIKVDRFRRLSILEEHAKILEQHQHQWKPVESVELLNCIRCGSKPAVDADCGASVGVGGDYREVLVVDLEDKAAVGFRGGYSDGGGSDFAGQLFDESRERAMICGIDMEMMDHAEAAAADNDHDDSDDWEAVERNEIEELLRVDDGRVDFDDDEEEKKAGIGDTQTVNW